MIDEERSESTRDSCFPFFLQLAEVLLKNPNGRTSIFGRSLALRSSERMSGVSEVFQADERE